MRRRPGFLIHIRPHGEAPCALKPRKPFWIAGLVEPAPLKAGSNVPQKPLHELSIEELHALVARAQTNLEHGETEIANWAKPINVIVSDPDADLLGYVPRAW